MSTRQRQRTRRRGRRGAYAAGPLPLPRYDEDDPFSRVDLVFHEIDHSGPSFEAHVFLDNAKADGDTPLEDESGYVGSFHIFGHGGCFGDVGHCEITERPHPFDRRAPHQLTPQTRLIVVTEAIKRLAQTAGDEVAVTVVPVVEPPPAGAPKPAGDVLRFSRLSLITYE
jgi:tyrosinase